MTSTASSPATTRCCPSSPRPSGTSPASTWCTSSATWAWTPCPGPGAAPGSPAWTSRRRPSRRLGAWPSASASTPGSRWPTSTTPWRCWAPTYDITYQSLGSLNWHPDIDRWAGILHTLTRPGGRYCLLEGHPMGWVLDDAGEKVEYPYFFVPGGERISDEGGTYADMSASHGQQRDHRVQPHPERRDPGPDRRRLRPGAVRRAPLHGVRDVALARGTARPDHDLVGARGAAHAADDVLPGRPPSGLRVLRPSSSGAAIVSVRGHGLDLRLRPRAPDAAPRPEGPARRQGGEPGRDDLGPGPAGPAGVHDHDRGLCRLPAGRLARGTRRRAGRARRPAGDRDGPSLRGPGRPAAAQRALGGQVLHARDDGHHPEPGSQPGEHGGPGGGHRSPVVRPGQPPPPDPDVRVDGGRGGRRRLRPRRRPRRGRPGRGGRPFRRRVRRRGRDAVPGGPGRPSCGTAVEAVFKSWNTPRADAVPAPGGHPRRPGHRGQRAGDGLRQPRRPFGHGRGLHPRPGDRGRRALRRLPGQRPG